MKGPTVSPDLLEQLLNVKSQDYSRTIDELGHTLKRMFDEKRLTRMWIDAETNQVYCE